MQRRLLNESQAQLVLSWWESLQPDENDDADKKSRRYPYGRKERAVLRRAEGLEDLLACEAVIRLARDLARLEGKKDEVPSWYYEEVALAAGVMAHVRKNAENGQTLAASLGARQGGADRAVMSELRFRALQRCRDPEDLLRHLRRAVKLVGGNVCVAQLANDIMAWQKELRNAYSRGASSVRFLWAADYYTDFQEQFPEIDQNDQPEI